MAITKLQQKVIDAVKVRLEKYSWFKGVCLDRLPNDIDIEFDFEDAVDMVAMDTEYWDNPNLLKEKK